MRNKTLYIIILSFFALFSIRESIAQDSPDETQGYKFHTKVPVGIKSKVKGNGLDVQLFVKNLTNRFLDFRWVDRDGNLVLLQPKAEWGHKSIGFGNSFGGKTSNGSAHIICDALNGEVLGCIVLEKAGNYSLTITEEKGVVTLNKALQ
jgi:hypothetical protein